MYFSISTFHRILLYNHLNFIEVCIQSHRFIQFCRWCHLAAVPKAPNLRSTDKFLLLYM